jgi:hypothetical protein
MREWAVGGKNISDNKNIATIVSLWNHNENIHTFVLHSNEGAFHERQPVSKIHSAVANAEVDRAGPSVA